MKRPSAKKQGPVPTLEIRFTKVNSYRFSDAVRLAKTYPGYRAVESGDKTIHTLKVALPVGDSSKWLSLRRLVSIVKGWRTAAVLLNGKESRSWDLECEMNAICDCYADYDRSLKKEDYCRGKRAPDEDLRFLTCRHEKGVGLVTGWGRDIRWYQFGTLSPDTSSFRIDKTAILAALKSSTTPTLAIHCPAFSWGRAADSVSSLPDEVRIGKDSGFELKYSELNREIPVGIRKTDESRGALSMRLSLALPDVHQEPAVGADARSIPSVRFSDVAGQDKALALVRDVVELPLRFPEYFESVGVASHKGILLFGPPGNGKTLIAKAIASECNAHLETINGPEVLSKWVGQSEANLRGIFERANRLAPSVILIDELDAIAPQRAEMDQQHEVTLISQMLVLMDGLRERRQVVVIGTTNRLDAIDPAMRRPGRLDYMIEIPKPDRSGREAIFRASMRGMRVSDEVDPSHLGSLTDGFSGADIASICREAGLAAIKRAVSSGTPADACVVTKWDFDRALIALDGRRTSP
jgi:AAA+ superfamily predicted ATPase